jgi:hypothetical protein
MEAEKLKKLISQLNEINQSSYAESSEVLKKVDFLTETNKSREKECLSATQNKSLLEKSLLNISCEKDRLLKSIGPKHYFSSYSGATVRRQDSAAIGTNYKTNAE